MDYVGCQIEAMTNLIEAIMSYNTEANQLSKLTFINLSLFGTGDFTAIYAETMSVTSLTYSSVKEDTSQATNALYELAN